MDVGAGLLATLFAAAGTGKLLKVEPLPSMFDRWGLPRALLPVVGTTELVGAALLLPRRTRQVGAALLWSVAAGALVTQVVNGDRLLATVPLLTGIALARVARPAPAA
jgi:uncharacterized membrane protein YphA (DoxX/SURF4 family)